MPNPTERKLNLSPRQATVMALETVERLIIEYHFVVPELTEGAQRELERAKGRCLARVREQLEEARGRLDG